MILNINTLREMVKAYIALGAREYNMEMTSNSLKYDEKNGVFKFNYKLKINDSEIDNSQILFKGDIINIMNYFIKTDEEIVDDYKVSRNEEKNDTFISLNIVKNNQKVKRYWYEISRIR